MIYTNQNLNVLLLLQSSINIFLKGVGFLEYMAWWNDCKAVLGKDVKEIMTQYDPRVILSFLGLTLDELRGKRVLDVGCGKDARLVEYLRGRSINAEGIDLDLTRTTDYLMKGDASADIRREARYYDLALSHMSMFQVGNHTTTDLTSRLLREQDNDEKVNTAIRTILSNAMEELSDVVENTFQVLVPGGRFFIYPPPDVFIVQQRSRYERAGVGIERRDFALLLPGLTSDYFANENYATVLTKPMRR